jgi:hypothetical protein
VEARHVAVQSVCAVGATLGLSMIVQLHSKATVCKASIQLLTAFSSRWIESREHFIWQKGLITEDQLCLVGPADAYARSPKNCLAFTSATAQL